MRRSPLLIPDIAIVIGPDDVFPDSRDDGTPLRIGDIHIDTDDSGWVYIYAPIKGRYPGNGENWKGLEVRDMSPHQIATLAQVIGSKSTPADVGERLDEIRLERIEELS